MTSGVVSTKSSFLLRVDPVPRDRSAPGRPSRAVRDIAPCPRSSQKPRTPRPAWTLISGGLYGRLERRAGSPPCPAACPGTPRFRTDSSAPTAGQAACGPASSSRPIAAAALRLLRHRYRGLSQHSPVCRRAVDERALTAWRVAPLTWSVRRGVSVAAVAAGIGARVGAVSAPFPSASRAPSSRLISSRASASRRSFCTQSCSTVIRRQRNCPQTHEPGVATCSGRGLRQHVGFRQRRRFPAGASYRLRQCFRTRLAGPPAALRPAGVSPARGAGRCAGFGGRAL